jgi:hypothetical protein
VHEDLIRVVHAAQDAHDSAFSLACGTSWSNSGRHFP